MASSTSGFTPSELQRGARDPGQILVCHPFNPVYLLPLVEVVASAATPASLRARAVGVLRSIGMHPLLIRKEVAAHVAPEPEIAARLARLSARHTGLPHPEGAGRYVGQAIPARDR